MSDFDAIKAAVNAQFATPPVLTLKEAASATRDYVNIFPSRRYVADQLYSGEVTVPGGRVVIRYACRSEGNVDVFRARVRAALEDKILPSGLGPFVFETEDPVEQDGDWFVSSDSWTY